ncbi:MAG: hypothetical protein KJO07_16090 [Deltaproteobacteria bacterium]|nr:hypothetical protein [Deltaproteobacteria bacterium]
MGASAQNRAAAAAATMVAAGLIAQQVAGKAVRDAFFLSNWPAENLPMVMVASSVLSVVIVLAFTRYVVRHSPARVVPWLFGAHAALYVGEYFLAQQQPATAAVAVYVHSTALGATVVSGFWSVINEAFDPHTAKRVISRIAGGATAGGMIGGLLAWQLGQYVDLPTMLIILAIINVGATVGVARISAAHNRTAKLRAITDQPSGLKVMRDVPYLRHVAVLVITATMVEACIDYVFKAEAKAAFDAAALISFFAIFHTVIATSTFVLQTTVARRSLHKLGLAGTVATLPATNVIGAVVALFLPGVWPLVALRGSSMTVENSLYRSGYELLYTPLVAAQKRPTKTIIDVGADRLGSTLGSGLALALIWLAPDHVRPALLLSAFGLAILALLISGFLHRGYISALADSLRAGAVELDVTEARDATTRQTLADTAMALDREKLLAQIKELREHQGATDSELPAVQQPDADDAAPSGPRTGDPIAEALAELRSGEYERIRAALKKYKSNLPRELVPRTIELLARDDVHSLVLRMLRPLAGRHVGQLCDALLDPDVDFAIRRRVPRILGYCYGERCVDGLLAGLFDSRFEVRYRCGLALNRISQRAPELEIERQAIFEAAKREAERGEHVWRSQKLLDASLDEGSGPFVGGELSVGHSLEHVFTILSLVLEREPLLLAYRALATDDPGLRGTGLEYLENVLPADIRRALWPYLDDQRVTKSSTRDRDDVVRELLSSMSSMAIDVDAVRKAAANHGREARRAEQPEAKRAKAKKAKAKKANPGD